MKNKKPIVWAFKKISEGSGKEGRSYFTIEKGIYHRKDKRRIFCHISPDPEIQESMKYTGFTDNFCVFNFTEKRQDIDIYVEPSTLEKCIVATGNAGGRITRHSTQTKDRMVDEVVIYPWDNPNPEGKFEYLQDFYEGKIKVYDPTIQKSIELTYGVRMHYLEKILRGIEVEPMRRQEPVTEPFMVYRRDDND